MAWVYLFAAGLCEVAWAVAMKHSGGLRTPAVTLWMLLFMVLSFVLLAKAMASLPLGTAYAIWTGIGAIGTVLWGMIYLGESRQPLRLACIGLIIAGILGLRYLTGAPDNSNP